MVIFNVYCGISKDSMMESFSKKTFLIIFLQKSILMDV